MRQSRKAARCLICYWSYLQKEKNRSIHIILNGRTTTWRRLRRADSTNLNLRKNMRTSPWSSLRLMRSGWLNEKEGDWEPHTQNRTDRIEKIILAEATRRRRSRMNESRSPSLSIYLSFSLSPSLSFAFISLIMPWHKSPGALSCVKRIKLISSILECSLSFTLLQAKEILEPEENF